MKCISAAWKKDKRVLFTRGLMLLSALAAMICFISYYIIGEKVLPDGTLIEPFALILTGYLFVFVFMACILFNFIFLRKRKMNTK